MHRIIDVYQNKNILVAENKMGVSSIENNALGKSQNNEENLVENSGINLKVLFIYNFKFPVFSSWTIYVHLHVVEVEMMLNAWRLIT